MKIGDKVRYLNDVGGGVIARFQDKDVVFVLEEDGFETPVSTRNVVVVQSTNEYNFSTSASLQNTENEVFTEEKTKVIQQNEYSFDEKDETEEGEKINLFFAFVPQNIKQLQTSPMNFYLINESNYYIDFQLLAGNQKTSVHCADTVEPQTNLFLQKIEKEAVNEYEFLRFQAFAYKNNKIFTAKPVIDVTLKINPVDFYKLHNFRENVFFDDNAMIISIIENDLPPLKFVIDPKAMQKALHEKNIETKPKKFAPPKKQEIIEIDLHIAQLLDSTNGLTNSEMLQIQMEKFNAVMKENLKNRGQKIVFIHGKGEGVLRQEIEKQLKKNYRHCIFQDASFQQYGFGATQVTIRR